MKKLTLLSLFFALFLVACGGGPPGGTADAIPSVADLSTCETAGVADQSADPNIEELRQAMVTFRSSLSEELRTAASNCLDSGRLYLWHNTPAANSRDGITYGDLSEEQLAHFQTLLQGFLSDEGYRKVDEITFLAEGFLSEIRDNVWSPDYYSIDMFGDPENSGSWGFQLDGHHAAVNFLVHGDSVSIVPAFLAGEPVIGEYNGVQFDIFQSEREIALSIYNGLNDAEYSAAVSSDSDVTMFVGPADQNGQDDPYIGDYDYSGFETGLKYTDMSAETQAKIQELMKVYVYNLTTPFADVWWEGIEENIEDTYFVWIDDVDSPSTYSTIYYRIYNPHVWIEYNVEGVIGNNVEEGNHVHSITRVPSSVAGGDYGIFANAINNGGPRTLLEHYAEVDHHMANHMQFDYTIADLNDHGHGHSHDS